MMTNVTITDALEALGFKARNSGVYAMYVLGELMLCHVNRTSGEVVVRGNIMHRDADGDPWSMVHTAERAESTETHGTLAEAAGAAAMLVAAELLGPTLDRADELLREATLKYLTESQQNRYRGVEFGFAVDHHDYVESPGLELTIVGVNPLVERAAVEPDVALYPSDLTAERIAELGEALAESITLWERGELW